MRQGSLRLTGLDTVSLGGAPLRLADSDFRQEELRSGGFQRSSLVVFSDPQHPDLSLTVTSVVEEGSVVAIQGRATGTHRGTLRTPPGDIPPSGRAIDFTFAEDYEVRGGLIVSAHLHFDRLELLEQLGVTPAPVPA
jgi:predicted ester cyclase